MILEKRLNSLKPFVFESRVGSGHRLGIVVSNIRKCSSIGLLTQQRVGSGHCPGKGVSNIHKCSIFVLTSRILHLYLV